MLFNNRNQFFILREEPHTKSNKVLFSLAALSLSASVPLSSLAVLILLSKERDLLPFNLSPSRPMTGRKKFLSLN